MQTTGDSVAKATKAAHYWNYVARIGKEKVKDQRIVRYFADVHLGNGHHGLAALAKEHKIDCYNLKAGEYVLFTNRSRNALKMFAPGNVVAHLKLPESAVLDLRIIAHVPKFFNGTKIAYTEALESLIRKDFGPKN